MQNGNPVDIAWNPTGSRPLTLTSTQRGKHLAIFGGRGTGKSKLVEHMIRSDIMAWPKSRCGIVLLDPHGSLFDGIMQWVAANNFRRWPIVPIDLRRDDWVVAYNPLRQRAGDGDPAVFVSAFARAIIQAWGQADANSTPRLQKWLHTLLATAYELKATLADAFQLITDPDLRRMMIGQIHNEFAQTVWEESSRLRPGEFHEEVASTVNRLRKFLSNRAIRACLCQTGPSLDLAQSLASGSIILVCLATDGARIDEEDAATFGSLLLADLWTAAKARGKRDEGPNGVKPCYIYLDEFQEFLSPTMAKTLDQARGFGLHFTLSAQYPTQMLLRGDTGREVYHSVMANARSKVVFSLEHPDDLPQLTLWLHRQQIDPDQIKHRQATTKVMGYRIETMSSTSHSNSKTVGETKTEGNSRTAGTGSARSLTVGKGGASTSTYGTGGSRGYTVGRSTVVSRGESSDKSDGESQREPESSILPFLGDDDPPKTLNHSDSTGESSSSSETESESRTDTESWNESTAETNSWNESTADTESRSAADTTSASLARANSTGETQGVSYSPMLFPIMGKEMLPPQFRSIEEQVFLFAQYLSGQADRRCVARVVGDATAVRLVTFEVGAALTTRRWINQFTCGAFGRLPFALLTADAMKCLADRRVTFADDLLRPPAAGATEPATSKRRIQAKVLPVPGTKGSAKPGPNS